MKFLVILLAVALTSASAARPFNANDNASAKFLDGVSSAISQIVQSIQAAIHQVEIQAADLIQQEKENIENSVRNAVAEYQNFVAEVAADFYRVINDEIRPCFNGVPEKLEKVRNETREAIATCRQNGRDQYEELRPEIQSYCNSSRELIQGAREYIRSCFQQQNIGDAIKCGVNAARNVSSTADSVRENNRIVWNIYQTQVRDISKQTRACIANEITIGRSKVRDIFTEVGKCIEEARNSTSTTSSAGDATETTTEA